MALLGVVRAGAAYLPLDSQAPADRVAAILDDARARAVVTGPPGDGRRTPTALAGAALFTVAEPGEAKATADPRHPDIPADETSPLCVGYTSGSPGVPKGVIVPHGAVHDLVTDPDQPGAISRGDRVGQFANPAFDAFTWEFWGALTTEAPLIILPTVVETPLEHWSRLLVAEGVTMALLTTAQGASHQRARRHPAGGRPPVRRSARPSGAAGFAGRSWRPAAHCGAPVLLDAVAYFDCAVHATHPTGDHTLLVGRVEDFGVLSHAPALMFADSRLGPAKELP